MNTCRNVRSAHKIVISLYIDTMFLFNNELTGFLPTTIGNMEDMSEFDACAFRLYCAGSIISNVFFFCTEDLQLHNNKFMGPIPSELGSCFQLQKIEFQDNLLSGTIPSTLGGLEKLCK